MLCLFAVLPNLELKPNCGSDRAWVWSTPADFADEEQKTELLAIRFANAESMFQPALCNYLIAFFVESKLLSFQFYCFLIIMYTHIRMNLMGLAKPKVITFQHKLIVCQLLHVK